jgi:predicted RNA-binding protein YlqC (UPF0109 family)
MTDRLAKLVVSDPDGEEAPHHIPPAVSGGSAASNGNTSRAPTPLDGSTADQGGPFCEIGLLVFNVHVGRIIGKKGQTITDIQERSGAMVEIPQHCEPGTAFRRIVIRGTSDQVDYCSVLVRLQLPSQSEADIAALQQEVQDLQGRRPVANALALRVIEVPMQHVGRIIGRKGAFLRQLKRDTGATVTLPRFARQGSPHQIFTIMGVEEEVAACEAILKEKIEDCRNTPSLSPSHSAPPGHEYRVPHGGNGVLVAPVAAAHFPSVAPHIAPPLAREVLFVKVPNEHVGRVIGKQGAAIKELQMQTGARVRGDFLLLRLACVSSARASCARASSASVCTRVCVPTTVAYPQNPPPHTHTTDSPAW